MHILVGLKWSALRTEVDPLSGAASVGSGQFGVDPASRAALMWALQLAQPVEAEVTAVTVGPAEAAAALRDALSLGAGRALRIDGAADSAPIEVAAALAPLATDVDVVVVGAQSIDGGSAVVGPALAAELERAQACGLLSVDWDGDRLFAQRRLPAGRREHVRLGTPAVISMEAGSITLTRAPLPAVLAAASARIEVIMPERSLVSQQPGTVVPYRPRPRTTPAPPAGDEPRDRIAALTGALGSESQTQQVDLPAGAAAAEIVAALQRWGYLEED